MRLQEEIEKAYKLTAKEKDDATKRIDNRIAELHRQEEGEQSLKSENGNLAESHSYSGYFPREPKSVGAQSVVPSSAKIDKKFPTKELYLHNLADFITALRDRTDITADNFVKTLFEGMGMTPHGKEQKSEYVHFSTDEGEKITIRLADHNGNALSIIKKGGRADKGYSIVIETPLSPITKFKSNKYADVLEFVYKNPSKERLEEIAKGIFDLVDNGEYTDLAGADEIHPSPKVDRAAANEEEDFFQITKYGNLSKEVVLDLVERLKAVDDTDVIGDSTTEELFRILRDLAELNSNAYKGYGALTEEEWQINREIYSVKSSLLKKIATELNSRGEDVGYKGEVIYFREPDTGIQLSFHDPYRLGSGLSRIDYNNKNPQWDGVRYAWRMTPHEYKEEAKRAQYFRSEAKVALNEYADYEDELFYKPFFKAASEILNNGNSWKAFCRRNEGRTVNKEDVLQSLADSLFKFKHFVERNGDIEEFRKTPRFVLPWDKYRVLTGTTLKSEEWLSDMVAKKLGYEDFYRLVTHVDKMVEAKRAETLEKVSRIEENSKSSRRREDVRLQEESDDIYFQITKRNGEQIDKLLSQNEAFDEKAKEELREHKAEGVEPLTDGKKNNSGTTSEGGELFRTSEELNSEYGDRWLSEQTNEDGRHTTQVKNTINSYKKFGEWVKADSNGREVSVLDASSGLGLGTEWMRENGMEVDDVEPYPSENRSRPTFTSYDEINKKYDYIISNAVLNVIPDDWRAKVLHDMADKLKAGGKMVINVRGANSIAKQGKEGATRITLDDPSEILVLRPDGSIKAYQKGFTKEELKSWCEKELGEGYSVEIATKKNAGDGYDTAVVVTKNNESNTLGVASETGHPRRSAQPVSNSEAKIGDNSNIIIELDKVSKVLSEKEKMGAHEFLYSLSRAFGYTGVSLKESYYKNLGESVGIRIADHYADVENFEKKGENENNYGVVVKLIPNKFKDKRNVDYLEYVYYPDKLSGKRQREIVNGLKKFLQTGDFSALPRPDRINPSGRFKKDDLYREGEGSASSPEGIESAVNEMAGGLNTKVRIIRDVNEITDENASFCGLCCMQAAWTKELPFLGWGNASRALFYLR